MNVCVKVGVWGISTNTNDDRRRRYLHGCHPGSGTVVQVRVTIRFGENGNRNQEVTTRVSVTPPEVVGSVRDVWEVSRVVVPGVSTVVVFVVNALDCSVVQGGLDLRWCREVCTIFHDIVRDRTEGWGRQLPERNGSGQAFSPSPLTKKFTRLWIRSGTSPS